MADPDTNAESAEPRPCLIVIAHGSRADAANDAHRRLCEALAVRLGRTVEPAFLELCEPSLSAAVGRAIADGATAVTVLPYFLHPGNHTTRDIPALIDAARIEHPTTAIEQLPLFGADPALIELLALQAGR